jgi:hypothetical protein
VSIEQPAPVDELLLSAGRRSSLQLPLAHLQLRDKVINALRRHRITTIGQAEAFVQSEASVHFPYRHELVAALGDFAACTADDRTDWRAFWRRRGHRFEQLCATLPELEALGETAHRQPVNRATFGNAGAMLERAGYDDLGKLRDGLATGIQDVPGLGRGKLQVFFTRLV